MDNMKKYAFYMPKSLIDDVDNTINSLGKMSRAEFIREAVDFYIGYLNSLKANDYLSPMLSRAIKSEIESVEKNVSEMIFKLAVQSAVSLSAEKKMKSLNSQSIDQKQMQIILDKKQARGQRDGVSKNDKKEVDESKSQTASQNLEALFELGAMMIRKVVSHNNDYDTDYESNYEEEQGFDLTM